MLARFLKLHEFRAIVCLALFKLSYKVKFERLVVNERFFINLQTVDLY